MPDDTSPPSSGIGRVKLRKAAGSVSCSRNALHDILVFVVTGKVTARHFTAGLDQGADLGAAERMLWNIVGADLTNINLEELRACVSRLFAGPWAPRRCAFRAEPGPTLAAASLMVLAADELGLGERVAAFPHRDAAFAWLGIVPIEATPAPPEPRPSGR